MVPVARIGLFFGVCCFTTVVVQAGDALVAAATAPSIRAVKTPAGESVVRFSKVEAASGVIAVIAPDTLEPGEMPAARARVASLYTESKGAVTRLFVLDPGGTQQMGLFRNRAELVRALDEVAAPGATAWDAFRIAGLYTRLADLAASAPRGSHLIFIGNLPHPAGDALTYAIAYLSRKAFENDVRVNTLGITEPPESIDQLLVDPHLVRVSWADPPVIKGFRYYEAVLAGPNDRVPAFSVAPGFQLPSPSAYLDCADALHRIAELQSQPATPETRAGLEEQLARVLAVNPGDQAALRLSFQLAVAANDHVKAAAAAGQLSALDPADGKLQGSTGDHLYAAGQFDAAEPYLKRAVELKAATSVTFQELARIYLERLDYTAAMEYARAGLNLASKDQALWFLLAEAAAKDKNSAAETDALARGVALGGPNLDRRNRLVSLYLAQKRLADAAREAAAAITVLPADLEVREQWARIFEEARLNDKALALWSGILEKDPARESARVAALRLLLAAGRPDDAVAVAGAGLELNPRSAELHLARTEALEQKHATYAARDELRHAATTIDNTGLLEKHAQVEDLFGPAAPEAFQRLVEKLQKSGAAPDRLAAAAARGYWVSLREGDEERARWFAPQAGGAGLQGSGPSGATAGQAGTIMIPGGRDALAFLSGMKSGLPPGEFVAEYARTVVSHSNKADTSYGDTIETYFGQLSTLLQRSRHEGSHAIIPLSVEGKKSQKDAEKTLALFGWKLETKQHEFQVQAGEKKAQALRQELASALAIDPVGIQDAFNKTKPYNLDIPFEPAEVLFSEAQWRDVFYPKQTPPGGLVQALVQDPEMAKTYVGLSAMDRETARVLLGTIGLKVLAGKYADRLLQFASAIAVSGGSVMVPGGEAARPVWAGLAGASPSTPDRFLRALLDKDNGDLLAYYFALSQLDGGHQRFFTRTASRTGKFYQLFKELPEARKIGERQIHESSFGDFLREVPLDEEGSIIFPGAPEVWMVVKGKSSSVAHSSKLMKKVHKTVAPDVEDEILIRLVSTRYKFQNLHKSELDNFLAVTRIDEHRDEPLDEQSAVMLAQHFADYGSMYPYFSTFTALSEKEFRQFFLLTEKLAPLGDNETAEILSFFDPLVEILRIAAAEQTVDQKHAAALFGAICERYSQAKSPAVYATAALDLIEKLTASAGVAARTNFDDAVRSVLLGKPAPGSVYQNSRVEAFKKVLDAQKIPSLESLHVIESAARTLAAGQHPELAATLQEHLGRLPAIELPKQKDKNAPALSAKVQKLPRFADLFRQKLAKKKVNANELQKIDLEMMGELASSVSTALTGAVYAFYLRPEDLLVSEDPLLVRKHQFTEHKILFPNSDFRQSSENAGSNFVGPFSTFAMQVGSASLAGAKGANVNARAVAGAQIGSLRSTPWSRYNDEEQRLVGLKVRAAREWISRASDDASLRAGLAEDTLGLLSLARRRTLLDGLKDRRWTAVWNSVSVSDLYFLGNRFLARYETDPWPSPVTRQLRALAGKADGAESVLGSNLSLLYGCSHPHLVSLAPYEEYERRFFPTPLAERVAELKLYLAEYMDRSSIPSSQMGMAAEGVARDLFAKVHMTSPYDWRSVLAEYGKLNRDEFDTALSKN